MSLFRTYAAASRETVTQPVSNGDMQVVLVIWLGGLFMNLSHIAEVYLAPVLLRLSGQLKCPPRLTAVTFLAWANEAPDMSANIAAIRRGRYQMALGSCVGAGMLVVCGIGGLLVRMAKGKMKIGGSMVRHSSHTVQPVNIQTKALFDYDSR